MFKTEKVLNEKSFHFNEVRFFAHQKLKLTKFFIFSLHNYTLMQLPDVKFDPKKISEILNDFYASYLT